MEYPKRKCNIQRHDQKALCFVACLFIGISGGLSTFLPIPKHPIMVELSHSNHCHGHHHLNHCVSFSLSSVGLVSSLKPQLRAIKVWYILIAWPKWSPHNLHTFVGEAEPGLRRRCKLAGHSGCRHNHIAAGLNHVETIFYQFIEQPVLGILRVANVITTHAGVRYGHGNPGLVHH